MTMSRAEATISLHHMEFFGGAWYGICWIGKGNIRKRAYAGVFKISQWTMDTAQLLQKTPLHG
jgi:hypothetical protein